MAILDLRPEKGSILDRLLRLGLVYDHEEQDTEPGKTWQYWADYSKSLIARFLHPDDAEVIFTDQDTRLSKTVSAEELKTISSVITWRSKNGAPGTVPPDESGTDLDLT